MARSKWKKTHSLEWWVWRMGLSEWWVRRCGESGFVGNLVRAGSRTMARRSHRWCDDLSTLSSFSLYLSLRAWFGNGEMISMICDWVWRGWVWTIGAMRSSCSDVGDLLALSLSLSSIFQGRKSFEVKMKTEIIFHRFGYILRSTRNAFQFDQIWSNN